jgi:hypothetical protein
MKITYRQGGDLLTLGDLRQFLAQCDRAGISDLALITDVRTKGLGKLRQLAASDESSARGEIDQ